MATAGLPANFWVMNPLIGDANVRRSVTSTHYHSMQTEVRRRLAQGLLVNGNYTWSRRFGSNLDSLHFDRVMRRATNVPHSIKLNGFYELPFGRGKRFGTDWHPVRRRHRRRLVAQHDGPHAERNAVDWRRRAGGHVGRRAAERIQVPDR